MAFEKLLNKVSELTQTGIAKGKELADEGVAKAKELKEIGKLKVENATEQENIKKAYLEIGRLYYAEHGENPDEAYAGLCEKITTGKAKIEYNLERIADMKAASNLSDDEIEAEAVEVEDCGCGCGSECETAPAEEPVSDCGCDCGSGENTPEA